MIFFLHFLHFSQNRNLELVEILTYFDVSQGVNTYTQQSECTSRSEEAVNLSLWLKNGSKMAKI